MAACPFLSAFTYAHGSPSHAFSSLAQKSLNAHSTAPRTRRSCFSISAPHAEGRISTRSCRRAAHDAPPRASMRYVHCARVPRFSSLPCRRGHDLAMDQHVVRVRVVRVCGRKRGLFWHQEPDLTLISNAHVCTIKPQNLDLAPGSVRGTYTLHLAHSFCRAARGRWTDL